MKSRKADLTTALPSRGRQILINTFILAIVAGSVISLAAQREYWPFSPYPMFAGLQGPTLDVFEVVGIRGADEISIAPSVRRRIVSGTRHQAGLALLLSAGTERDLTDYLERLARQYHTGHANEPPLDAVRVYRAQWRAQPENWPPISQVSRVLLHTMVLAR